MVMVKFLKDAYFKFALNLILIANRSCFCNIRKIAKINKTYNNSISIMQFHNKQ